MKKIVLFLSAITCMMLTSCSSTYFYSVLQTANDDVEKVDNGDFLYQNDSLWIAYCFKGEDAPIQITVYNKLNTPLYIDWNRSSLIINNEAYPYKDGEVLYSESSEGGMQLPKNISFIPPKTKVSHRTLRITPKFDKIDKKEYADGKLGLKGNFTASIKRISYTEENTPLRFGSYLTIYSNPEKPQSYRSDFYVTNLMKTSASPKSLPADMADRGDTFYQHVRPDNTGWEVLGVTAIIAGAVTIDVLTHDHDDCYNCH